MKEDDIFIFDSVKHTVHTRHISLIKYNDQIKSARV